MSKLKHYKGKDWEVKVGFIDGLVIWKDRVGELPFESNSPNSLHTMCEVINDEGTTGISDEGEHFCYLFKDHLDNLTKPKIINERPFDNDNFKIRIWETEDKIGAETVWVREGFEWNYYGIQSPCDATISEHTKTYIYNNDTYPFFGYDPERYERTKTPTTLTFTDLCKALEKAEQETSELTYDTVVKELEGLRGIQLVHAMSKFEYSIIDDGNNAYNWHRLTQMFFGIREAVERGLIKLRRAK